MQITSCFAFFDVFMWNNCVFVLAKGKSISHTPTPLVFSLPLILFNFVIFCLSFLVFFCSCPVQPLKNVHNSCPLVCFNFISIKRKALNDGYYTVAEANLTIFKLRKGRGISTLVKLFSCTLIPPLIMYPVRALT